MKPSPLEPRSRARLAQLRAEGLFRSLQPPAGIDLCSNDYLGLATHPLVRQKMIEAISQEGCGSTGSRLLRGERQCFAQLERRFAEFKGVERALYFSSGYLANLAVLTTFPERDDIIYSDERNHASLIDGIRLSRARCRIFPHNDAKTLGRWLMEEGSPCQQFVVTESLFSMDGDNAALSELAELCGSMGAALIVDEAHAVGIYGARGTGLLEAASARAFLSINTAGKALGASGAFVAGPDWAIEYLIQRARPFVFSTAAPPPIAAALEASLTLVESEGWRRVQLLARARHLRQRLAQAGIAVPAWNSHIIPIVLGDNEHALQVAQALQRQGFDVRAIRPPSVPAGTARLRLSVNANLSEEVLDRFVTALLSALQEVAPCPAACL
jgi:8-amino-7-oxononanoate synthase